MPARLFLNRYGDSVMVEVTENMATLFLSLSIAPTGVIADFTQTTLSIGGGTITGLSAWTLSRAACSRTHHVQPESLPLYPISAGPAVARKSGAWRNDQVTGSYYTQSWGGDGTTASTPAPRISYVLAGEAGNDVLIGGLPGSKLDGGTGDDTITGGGGMDTLTGGSGADQFRDTAAGLNGDIITDFAFGDKVIIIDGNISGFSFTLTGNTLTFTGGSMTLQGTLPAQLVASAASGGGVSCSLPPSGIYGTGAMTPSWHRGETDRGRGLETIIYGRAGNDSSLATTITTGIWRTGDDSSSELGDDYRRRTGKETLSITWGWE